MTGYKKGGILALMCFITILLINSCNEDKKIDRTEVNNAIVKYESEYWIKHSVAHDLVNRMISDNTQVLWSTNNHTAAPVPLGAVGPKKYTDKLQGILHNDSLGRVIKEAVQEKINVILVIGDGMGNMHMALPIYKRYGEHNKEMTYFEKIMSKGACGYLYTCTARGLVTGSAASGSAIACGQKTQMNMISVDTLGNPMVSSLKLAKENGYQTALVSDAGITDATPAAFYAHSYNRDLESMIASQLSISEDVDFVFGGGGSQFIPAHSKLSDFYKGKNYPDFSSARKDSANLFKKFTDRGYNLCFTTDEMNNINGGKAIGLFMGGGLTAKIERNEENKSVPTVKEMADKALELIDNSDNPYFTMIECARIDWESHDNDVVSVYKAVEEMNDVLAEAYQHYLKSPENTLLVFTADHETGGLEIAYKKVSSDKMEKKKLLDNNIWENNTIPLFFRNFSKHMENQDKTMSTIFSQSKTVQELKKNLLDHANIQLTEDQAELLFFAKEGYQKFKNK